MTIEELENIPIGTRMRRAGFGDGWLEFTTSSVPYWKNSDLWVDINREYVGCSMLILSYSDCIYEIINKPIKLKIKQL